MSSENEPSGRQRASGGDDPLVAPLDEPGGEGSGADPGPSAGGAPPSSPPGASPSYTSGATRSTSPAAPSSPRESAQPSESPNMLPGRRERRSAPERLLVRLIATCGIVGIGVAIAAIMVSSKSQGWVVGLVVSIVSVILAAILWSSRML